jgi:hypothetical protein
MAATLPVRALARCVLIFAGQNMSALLHAATSMYRNGPAMIATKPSSQISLTWVYFQVQWWLADMEKVLLVPFQHTPLSIVLYMFFTWTQALQLIYKLPMLGGPGYDCWLQKHLKQSKMMEVQIRGFQWPVADEAWSDYYFGVLRARVRLIQTLTEALVSAFTFSLLCIVLIFLLTRGWLFNVLRMWVTRPVYSKGTFRSG